MMSQCPPNKTHFSHGKQFISTVLEALETKTRMTGVIAHRYLMRAAMAGMIVAVFYIVNYAIVGVCDGLRIGDTSLAGAREDARGRCPSAPLSSSSTTRSQSCSPAT